MANHMLNLDNMPSNSDKARQEKKREEQKRKEIVPVVSKPAVRKKQTVGKKFTDTFFSESLETVKDYVIEDVIMPSIKDTFLDIIFQGLSMWISGDPGRTSTRKKSNSSQTGGYKPRVTYASYYDEPERFRTGTYNRKRDSYSLDDMIVESKGEAEKILDGMFDILENYDVVTVGDFYQLCNVSTEPSDFNYGWTNLEHASTKRVSGGYLVDLPRARAIKD